MTNTDQIQNGDQVKDIVSGLVGIVTARTTFMNGCIRCQLSPPLDKDGKFVQELWFDQEQLEILERGKIKPKHFTDNADKPGGDRPDHPQR